MCLDLTYDFAAAYFLPALTQIIESCGRVDDIEKQLSATHPAPQKKPPLHSVAMLLSRTKQLVRRHFGVLLPPHVLISFFFVSVRTSSNDVLRRPKKSR